MGRGSEWGSGVEDGAGVGWGWGVAQKLIGYSSKETCPRFKKQPPSYLSPVEGSSVTVVKGRERDIKRRTVVCPRPDPR